MVIPSREEVGLNRDVSNRLLFVLFILLRLIHVPMALLSPPPRDETGIIGIVNRGNRGEVPQKGREGASAFSVKRAERGLRRRSESVPRRRRRH